MAIETVEILKSSYSEITDATEMQQYVRNRVNNGTLSVIYAIPIISSTFYSEGVDIADAIQAAINKYNSVPTKANAGILKNLVALAIRWLDKLALLVGPIANSPANCTTREEAATNIEIIGFNSESLIYSRKGEPQTIKFTAEYVGGGDIEIDIIMGKDFHPTTITVVAVSVPPVTAPLTPLPVVKLVGSQLFIASKVAVLSFTKTITGKGKSLKLRNMETCMSWNIYLYCQNGNSQISPLSAPILVKLITPIEE